MSDQPTPNMPSRTSAYLAEAIQKTVEEMQRAERGGFISRLFSFIGEHWFVLAAILSIPIGYFGFGVSPFIELDRIEHEQQQYRQEKVQAGFNSRMAANHLRLGRVFLDEDLWREARAEFEDVEKLDSTSVEAHLGIMKTKIMEELAAGVGSEAYKPAVIQKRLAALQDACETEDPHVYMLMGRAWMDSDPKRSVEYLNKALALRDDIASVYNALGLISYMQNDIDKTIEFYEKAVELSPWQRTYLNNLAYQYLVKGDYQAASEKYATVLSLDGTYLLSCYTFANALLLGGRPVNARNVLEFLVRKLNDEEIVALEHNRGSFVFRAGNAAIWLSSKVDKKMYAHFALAMAQAITGEEESAHRNVRMAMQMSESEAQLRDVLVLVKWDVRKARAEQPSYGAKLDTFLETLTPGQ